MPSEGRKRSQAALTHKTQKLSSVSAEEAHKTQKLSLVGAEEAHKTQKLSLVSASRKHITKTQKLSLGIEPSPKIQKLDFEEKPKDGSPNGSPAATSSTVER